MIRRYGLHKHDNCADGQRSELHLVDQFVPFTALRKRGRGSQLGERKAVDDELAGTAVIEIDQGCASDTALLRDLLSAHRATVM